jgi:hypothetical protein
VSSKVDVMLSAEQMMQFSDQIITFAVENNGGLATLYAFGDKPKADIVLQATLTETAGEGVILGSSASTNTPRSDYGQTDASKADFIKNKPDAAIQKAQSTADSAKETAEAALPRTGGKMTGALDMAGNKLTNVPDPEADGDAVNMGYVTSYADGRRLKATVSVTAAGWSAEAPYTQTVTVEGMLETDRPHYGVVYSADADTRLGEKEAFMLVDDLDSAAGSVTFTCFEDKPGIDLTIQLEVNR